ncbi:MAG: hypothetical protein CV088_21055 [Nitrospira sp. LK70]|nr:hypothetical protein [Nitrospira sp. LK70]
MRWRLCWRILGGLSLLVIPLVSSTASAQTDAQNDVMDLICLTDRPTIVEGESTRLHVVVGAQAGNPTAQAVSFQWHVSDGTVQGSGPEVEWNLSKVGIKSGESHTKVTATVKAMTAGCTVEVFIGKKEPAGGEDSTEGTRGGLIPARRYLLPNQEEKPNYGLYSYVLLSAEPQGDKETARYLQTLEACLRVMRQLDKLGRYVRPSQLNATHIPVTELPKGREDDPDFAKKVLAVYDFDRARVLLNKFEKSYDRGPYLISVKPPLTQAPEPVPIHILQDFTGVVPKLAARVVKDFEYLAAQERTWSEQSMRKLPSKLRNYLAVASEVTPEVAGSLKTMIQFINLGE